MNNRSYIHGHEGHPHYIPDPVLQKLQDKFERDAATHAEIALVLRNLSDPTKLRIYQLLHEVEEIPVSDIVQVLGISQSAVSHALADLKRLDLVESKRCGQLMCYRLKQQTDDKRSILSLFARFFKK